MIGAIVIAVALVVVLPVSFAVGGGVMAAVLGFFLKQTGEEVNEGSELIDLNR